MLKRSKFAIALSLLLVAGSAYVPATAATKAKAGASCSKANSTAKIGSVTYTCTRNPISSKKTLVWISKDCVDADKKYQQSLITQKQVVDLSKAGIAMLQVDIKALQDKKAASEAEALTWDAKAADYKAKADAETAKAAELKARAATGGVTSADPKLKRNLQLALVDKKITDAEVSQLATAWGTTVDKVPFFIDFYSVEDRLASAKSYTSAATNSERKAASLRSTAIIDLKNKQIATLQKNITNGDAQVKLLFTYRDTICTIN